MTAMEVDEQLLAFANEEIRRRTGYAAKVPSIDLDLLKLSFADLDEYGLPRLPLEELAPRQYEFLRRMLSPTPRFLERPELRIQALNLHAMGGDAGGTLGGATGAFAGRWGTSRNWSGTVIAARDGGLFSSVSGSWTVPTATRPAGGSVMGPPPRGVFRQSVWIGLDGYRFCSRSLPQVGTVSQIGEQGAAEYYLWVQWWVRNKFFGEAKVEGFPVAAGDRIRATMEVRPTAGVRDNVRFVVTNHGQEADPPANPPAISIDWKLGTYGDGKILNPTGDPDTRERGDAPVEGRHAVWCVERPSVMPPAHLRPKIKPHELQPYSIPNFGQASFAEAVAIMSMPDGSAVERDLTAARHIRMIDLGAGGAPRVLVATSPQAPAKGGKRMVVAQN